MSSSVSQRSDADRPERGLDDARADVEAAIAKRAAAGVHHQCVAARYFQHHRVALADIQHRQPKMIRRVRGLRPRDWIGARDDGGRGRARPARRSADHEGSKKRVRRRGCRQHRREACVIGDDDERRRRGYAPHQPRRDVDEARAVDDPGGGKMRDPSGEPRERIEPVGAHDHHAGNLHDRHQRHGSEVEEQAGERDARERDRHHRQQRDLHCGRCGDRRREPATSQADLKVGLAISLVSAVVSCGLVGAQPSRHFEQRGSGAERQDESGVADVERLRAREESAGHRHRLPRRAPMIEKPRDQVHGRDQRRAPHRRPRGHHHRVTQQQDERDERRAAA